CTRITPEVATRHPERHCPRLGIGWAADLQHMQCLAGRESGNRGSFHGIAARFHPASISEHPAELSNRRSDAISRWRIRRGSGTPLIPPPRLCRSVQHLMSWSLIIGGVL